MTGLPQNSLISPFPTVLQQAWKEAQACWIHPFTHRTVPRLILEKQPLPSHSLWSDFSHYTVHLYWPDFDFQGTQSVLTPYLTVALAREIGYFYFAPGNPAVAAELQLQARLQLEEHSLGTADAMLQRFLELLVLDKLHQKGLATSSFLKRLESFEKNRLPPWMARLYEYLWRLPTGDLTQAANPQRLLTPLEETTACLCHAVFHHQRHGNPLHTHYISQLTLFLNYAIPHLHTPIETPTPLLMLLPQPLGLQIHPEQNQGFEDNSPPATTRPLANTVSASGVVQGSLSPRQILSRLPEHRELKLLRHYYRQAAWPYIYDLTPPDPQTESVLEGIEVWDIDHPIQQLHWQASLSTSPTLIPGITTRQQIQTHYPAQDTNTHQIPRLTLYLDTSQSMPNPHQEQSLIVLTGFVLMLSALNAKWPVRIINWSDGETNTGYTHDENTLSKALLQIPQGATHFPSETLTTEATDSSPYHEVTILLSDLGTIKSLQQLAITTPSTLSRLNALNLQCLLYLPLPLKYQQQSLHDLKTLLSHWEFHALTHPQKMSKLWSFPMPKPNA